MDDQNNQEYHEYLDMLAKQRFSGEITLYIKDGVIESSRESYRLCKNQLKETPAQRKTVKPKKP